MEMRLRGGFPRANAVKYVKEKHGVNMVACICAIDKASLPPLFDYWVPGTEVCGIHELVGNALVMEGEKSVQLISGESLWSQRKQREMNKNSQGDEGAR